MKFSATVEFRLECEGVEAARAALLRLQEASRAAGFDLVRGTLAPAPDDEEDGWGTPYGPRLDT